MCLLKKRNDNLPPLIFTKGEECELSSRVLSNRIFIEIHAVLDQKCSCLG